MWQEGINVAALAKQQLEAGMALSTEEREHVDNIRRLASSFDSSGIIFGARIEQDMEDGDVISTLFSSFERMLATERQVLRQMQRIDEWTEILHTRLKLGIIDLEYVLTPLLLEWRGFGCIPELERFQYDPPVVHGIYPGLRQDLGRQRVLVSFFLVLCLLLISVLRLWFFCWVFLVKARQFL